MKSFDRNFRNAFKRKFLFFSFIVSTSVYGQNLIVNPGFNSNASGWSTNCTIEINPETVYGGSVASNYVTEIDVERCINQQVCIFPGQSYNFSFKGSRRKDNNTPKTVSIIARVTGVQSGVEYINSIFSYSNTSFNLQTTSLSFSIPASSTDRKVKVEFLNSNNTKTYGVLIDDINLSPATSFAIQGPESTTLNMGTDFSIAHAPDAGVNYNWTFPGGTPANSLLPAPTGISWSVAGNKTISASLSNNLCTVVSLNKDIYVASILPVKLLSFTGERNNEKTTLRWSADNAGNDGHYFIIERAAQNGFDSIGKVFVAPGASVSSYVFTDNKPVNGANQYRLKQVDIHEGVSYSKIITVGNNIKNEALLYPNPAVSTLSYTINSAAKKEASIQVYTLSGKMAFSRKQDMEQGVNKGSIDISSLKSGAYFLVIASSEGLQYTGSFAKR
ncbi:MAG: T9SS type A sorting domain-containing protein [Chitinophagaceae bacterium]|nr:T9SS type A sorting domain-containing protein [Chitinophagaceae bacterium]